MGDIDKVVKWGRHKYGYEYPVSIAGFSLGGALTIKFANLKLHNFAWVLLLNPGIKANPGAGGKVHLSFIDRVKI